MENKQLKKYIGLKIKEKRQQANLRQEDVAIVLKLSRISIMNIESGRHSGTIHTIFIFCQLFNCTPNDLFPPINPLKYVIEEKVVRVKSKKKVLKIIH